MAKIYTLEPAVIGIQRRVNRNDSMYFKRMYGSTFAVRLDNPYTGPWSEAQKQQRQNFANVRAEWLTMPTDNPTRFQAIKAKFAAQHKYKTLAGFAMAKILADPNFPDEE